MKRTAWRPAAPRYPALLAGMVGALLLATFPVAAQQEGRISGRVVEGANQRPLAGAQVIVAGSTRGALSDANGRFTITGVGGTQVTLQAVMIGYRTATVGVRVGDLSVRIALDQAAVALDELVVTGTPEAARVRSLGNSVGKVDVAGAIQLSSPPNLHALISAEVPGLQVQLSRGEIGAGGNIRIRGASSMTLASEPLLYIDGVRVNNNFADNGGFGGVGTDGRTPPSRINDLNPEDIESIEIIKGPAAATLYGTEASNGVIQVITKRGRSGRPTFNLVMQQGANWLPNPEKLFGNTYFRNTAGEIEAFNVLRRDREVGFAASVYGGTCPEPYRLTGDRCKGEVFSTGIPRSFAGSVSGGSESMSYYFSADWDRDEGPVDYNWQNRLTGRGNMSWTPSEKVNVNFGISGIRSKLRSASAQQPITTAIIWSQPNTREGPFRGYIAYLPERYHDDILGFQDVDRTTYSLATQHRPFAWFSHRLTVGGDFTNTRNSELFRRVDVGVGSAVPLGAKTAQSARTAMVSGDYAATATFDPIRHLRSSTSAGLQYYQTQFDFLFGQGVTFPVSQLETVTAGATRTAREDFVETKTVGAYLQEQLSWKDRLFITAAVRGDDHSAFGTNYDFVLYPKLSLSWVASDEPFFAENRFVSTLKLRSAWGKAGQQPDAFAALRTYQPQVGVGGQPALTTENLGNPELQPEVGQEIELGFDAGLLNERVGLEVTFFDKRTKDAIVSVPAAPSLGFPGNQFKNIGEVKNTGFEIGLRAQPYRGRNVGVDLNLAFSRVDNEVVSLGVDAPLGAGSQFNVPGYSLFSIFRRRVVSSQIVEQNGVRVATNVMCEGGDRIPNSNLSAGGGPPVPCATAPAVFWGSVLPKWNGSASATLTLFNNLQLYGLVEAVGGHHWINGDLGAAHIFFNHSRAIVERTDPILMGYLALNDFLGGPSMMAGDFARLRRVSASYTLPAAIAQQIRAQRATLTVSAENLAVLWQKQTGTFGHRAIDPEAKTSLNGGLDAFNQEGWPQLRRFLATLRVTF